MTIGILGGGQLGRMLALAAYPLGEFISIFDPDGDCCAGHVAPVFKAGFGDTSALEAWAKACKVVTFESENIAGEVLQTVQRHTTVAPGLVSLTISQDRLLEKQRLRDLGIDTMPFAAVDSLADLQQALGNIGIPAVLKTRRGGYDGKGQRIIRSPDDAEAAFNALGRRNLIVEGFAAFSREVSIVGVRGVDGDEVIYPLTENEHRDGILRTSRNLVGDPLHAEAEHKIRRLMTDLGHVGALALELFDVQGRLIANEIAPRVHNTGHWTIEGAETSQFENHVRAITGRHLGVTETRGYCAMVNFIGSTPDLDKLLALPGVHAHFYGKTGRPGRKVGHATVVAASAQARDDAVAGINRLLAA